MSCKREGGREGEEEEEQEEEEEGGGRGGAGGGRGGGGGGGGRGVHCISTCTQRTGISGQLTDLCSTVILPPLCKDRQKNT